MNLSEFLSSDKSNQPHYLLIGEPVGHSLSPIMHNTALQHHGLNAEYHAVSIPLFEFDMLAAHFNSTAFLGANVTIPHKQNVIPLIDSLTDVAQRVGAVNTILKHGEKLIGDNTDAYGFTVPLEESEINLETDRAIIFGTGGATQAIITALNDLGFSEVYMVSRNAEKEYESDKVTMCTYDSWIHYSDEASLIINATPLGMTPNVNSSPVKEHEVEALVGKVCYDIVYNPRETKFLMQAESVGGVPIGGLDMLIHQGALSFKKWTGKEFPVGLIKMKLDEFF